jgi:hypothetical protein
VNGKCEWVQKKNSHDSQVCISNLGIGAKWNSHSLVTFRTKFNLDQILWNWMISNLLDNSCWTLQSNEFTKFNPSIGGPNDVQSNVWYCLETFFQRIQINVLICLILLILKSYGHPNLWNNKWVPILKNDFESFGEIFVFM